MDKANMDDYTIKRDADTMQSVNEFSAYVDTLPISAEHHNELVRLALKVFNAAERNAFLLGGEIACKAMKEFAK